MKYLFLRILEACNAKCWFCNFAGCDDIYRLSLDEYINIIKICKKYNFSNIRFTGGEPLLHKNIGDFIEIANSHGIKTSIITNGYLLLDKLEIIVNAGIDQVIVSIDDLEEMHNKNRGISNLYEKAIEGIKKLKEFGVKIRINTVCGPHNFKNMTELQKIFTDLGVEYWELSALKLDRKVMYNCAKEIELVGENLYSNKSMLQPYGKRWYGNTEAEKNMYINKFIPPKVNGICNMPNIVRYYDPKHRNLYVCSLLAHRGLNNKFFRHFEGDEEFTLYDAEIEKICNYFKINGQYICTGCSSTAAYLGEKGCNYQQKQWEY